MIKNCASNFVACGSVVNSTILSSLGYPNYYPENMDCTWTWKIPTGKILKVTFALLDIEPWWNCWQAIEMFSENYEVELGP